MQHSKTFKRKKGIRVKIEVHLSIQSGKAYWSQRVTYCEKGKRKFLDCFNGNSYEYRQLPFASDERESYKLNKQLGYCTLEEIQEVKQELKNSIPLD